MALVAHTSSGLEVYTPNNDLPSSDGQDQYLKACGQDNYPTAIRQDEYPTAYIVSPPDHAAIKEAKPIGESGSMEYLAGGLKAKESRLRRSNRFTFWLGLAVGALIVVVIVLGGVLGSRIRKESGSKRCVLNSPPYLRQDKFFLAAH